MDALRDFKDGPQRNSHESDMRVPCLARPLVSLAPMNRIAAVAASTVSKSVQAVWMRGITVATIYVVLYVILDWASYVRPQLSPGITPWNPEAGLTLALLLIYGWRWAPAVVAAALIAESLHRGSATSPMMILAVSLWIALTYVVLATILRRWGLSTPIRTAIDAARVAGAAVVGTLLVALGYVGLFVVAGDVPSAEAVGGIARYWIADLNGVLTLTPLLIYATELPNRLQLLRHHVWEILAQFAALVLILWTIFTLPAGDQLRFFYLLFVPIIWIALRWSWTGAMLGVLAIQIGLLVAAGTRIPTARFIDLQFLMLTLSLTALLLGAVVAERAGVLQRVAMREAEQRALLTMAPDAVLAVDASGEIRIANPAALRLFGDGSGVQQLKRLLPELNLTNAEGRAALDGYREDGTEFPAEVAWARLDPPGNGGYLVTVRDASDRRHAEQQLRERDAALARAMRFAVAGELASALAHELNQPITALVSYLHAADILAARTADDDERLKVTLDKAAKEAVRASQVLRRLRDFYQGGGALKREPVHIPSICAAVLSAFQDRLRKADTSLAVLVDPSIPPVEGDGTQLEIVLHNLLGNALDAVTSVPHELRRVALSASCVGGTIILCVEDSGPGLPVEVARKLFEPFVTSKPDGMGLGLAISRSLISARGGELSCAPSMTLGGAAFTIRFPMQIPAETSLV